MDMVGARERKLDKKSHRSKHSGRAKYQPTSSRVKVEDLVSNEGPEAPKSRRVPDDKGISKVSDQSL